MTHWPPFPWVISSELCSRENLNSKNNLHGLCAILTGLFQRQSQDVAVSANETIASFIWTINRNFLYWWNHQTATNGEQSCQQRLYGQGRNRRGGRSSHDRKPSFNQNRTISNIASKTEDTGDIKYAELSGPPWNNRNGKNSSYAASSIPQP